MSHWIFAATVLVLAGAIWRRPRLAASLPPMLWLGVFFGLPFLALLKISLAVGVFRMPPYSDLLTWDGPRLQIALTFENYQYLWEDSLYVDAYAESLKIAAISTVLCLLIGYPMALYIALQPPGMRTILLVLAILPFWTSFLLRVYAWIGFLNNTGLINSALIGAGLINEPIQMMQTDFAVYVAIVYTYLPFMVLPLYANLVKHERDVLEAAANLGARPFTAFLTITLPLSLPGVVAGSLLVFIPSVGEYVIPALMGGPDTLMIGRVLWDEFRAPGGWPFAAALAMALLAIVALPLMLLRAAAGVDKES